MKTSVLRSSLLICLFTQCLIAQNHPRTEISNKLIRAVIMLPNAQNGSYQGTRFDWSGIIASLQYKGHNYISPWHDQSNPRIHDALAGPAEEFLTSLGYSQAKPGGIFVRIGVGILRKPDEKAFHRFKTYDVAEPSQWKIRQGKNWIRFVQTLSCNNGYAYVYRKTLRLRHGRPELVIEHSLKNTGQYTIDTDEYSHNFFVIDHEVVGPDISIRFAFTPKPASELKYGAEVQGHAITFARELQKGQVVFTEIRGFTKTAHDFPIQIVNRDTGGEVQISSNKPLTKLLFWSIRTVACPETYTHLHIKPGQTAHWKVKFDFGVVPVRKTTGQRRKSVRRLG